MSGQHEKFYSKKERKKINQQLQASLDSTRQTKVILKLACAFYKTGRRQDAIEQFREAMRQNEDAYLTIKDALNPKELKFYFPREVLKEKFRQRAQNAGLKTHLRTGNAKEKRLEVLVGDYSLCFAWPRPTTQNTTSEDYYLVLYVGSYDTDYKIGLEKIGDKRFLLADDRAYEHKTQLDKETIDDITIDCTHAFGTADVVPAQNKEDETELIPAEEFMNRCVDYMKQKKEELPKQEKQQPKKESAQPSPSQKTSWIQWALRLFRD